MVETSGHTLGPWQYPTGNPLDRPAALVRPVPSPPVLGHSARGVWEMRILTPLESHRRVTGGSYRLSPGQSVTGR